MFEISEILGDKFYFENGILHRLDGPAIEFKSGVKYWINMGELHRENGPAIVDEKNRVKEYWIRGRRATDEETKNIKRNYWIDKNDEDK